MKSTTINLYQNSVDYQELLEVIKSFFEYRSKMQKNSYFFTLADGKENGLNVSFDATKRKIRLITQIGTVAPSIIRKLKEKIYNTLLENQEKRIGQCICFSQGKVTGTFHYNNLFQIIPAPINASQPSDGMLNAEYPFVLQFEYISSKDSNVDQMRRSREGLKYTRILNALLQCKISAVPRFIEMFWTEDRTQDTIHSSFKYVSSGYHIDGFKRYIDSFDLPTQEIPTLPFQTFYNHPVKTKSNNQLHFPDNLDESLDLYFSLNPLEQDKFYTAACWIESAEKIWSRSQSSSFIAYVSSLECLINNLEKCNLCSAPITISLECCSKCETPQYRIGKSFKDLLECNGVDDTFKEEKKLLYRVRSSLVHGSHLFARDKYGYITTTETNHDRILHSTLQNICSMVLHNWLRTTKLEK